MKAQSSLGNIKHNSAVIERQAEVSKMVGHFPYVDSTFMGHHWLGGARTWNGHPGWKLSAKSRSLCAPAGSEQDANVGRRYQCGKRKQPQNLIAVSLRFNRD
jgi:hypothetical protein